VEDPWRAQADCVLAEVDGGRMTSKREVIPRSRIADKPPETLPSYGHSRASGRHLSDNPAYQEFANRGRSR
jgi:hypothetical protein